MEPAIHVIMVQNYCGTAIAVCGYVYCSVHVRAVVLWL